TLEKRERAALLFLEQSVPTLLAQPAVEAGQRRERYERIQLGQLALQILDHLLDQEIAEGDATQALLAVRDRIEHRGPGALGCDGRAIFREQGGDRPRHVARERDLDEDERLVHELRMKEREAAAIRR